MAPSLITRISNGLATDEPYSMGDRRSSRQSIAYSHGPPQPLVIYYYHSLTHRLSLKRLLCHACFSTIYRTLIEHRSAITRTAHSSISCRAFLFLYIPSLPIGPNVPRQTSTSSSS
jgi:hypothetical protein